MDKHQGLKRVELRTAVELTDDEERLIAQRLKKTLNADVRTRTRVDPWLLGGLMVRIDDTILDGTGPRAPGDNAPSPAGQGILRPGVQVEEKL